MSTEAPQKPRTDDPTAGVPSGSTASVDTKETAAESDKNSVPFDYDAGIASRMAAIAYFLLQMQIRGSVIMPSLSHPVIKKQVRFNLHFLQLLTSVGAHDPSSATELSRLMYHLQTRNAILIVMDIMCRLNPPKKEDESVSEVAAEAASSDADEEDEDYDEDEDEMESNGFNSRTTFVQALCGASNPFYMTAVNPEPSNWMNILASYLHDKIFLAEDGEVRVEQQIEQDNLPWSTNLIQSITSYLDKLRDFQEANQQLPAELQPVDTRMHLGGHPQMFANMCFLLICADSARELSAIDATYENTPIPYNMQQVHDIIVQHGGRVIYKFTEESPSMPVYLISDCYYRTYNYLVALALGVPCIRHVWIYRCVQMGMLVDSLQYLLPAGRSIVDNKLYHQVGRSVPPLQGKLVVLHCERPPPPGSYVTFVATWEPLVRLLGGEATSKLPKGRKIDFLITDASANAKFLKAAKKDKAVIVSSEYLIQTLIMGVLPDKSQSVRFKHDCPGQAFPGYDR